MVLFVSSISRSDSIFTPRFFLRVEILIILFRVQCTDFRRYLTAVLYLRCDFVDINIVRSLFCLVIVGICRFE